MRPRRTNVVSRAPLVLIGVLAAAAALRCASVWDEPPPVLTSHFDARGQADGFMRRETFFSMLAALGGIPVLLLLGLPRLIGVRWTGMAPIRERARHADGTRTTRV
jgi:hypothetical protein